MNAHTILYPLLLDISTTVRTDRLDCTTVAHHHCASSRTATATTDSWHFVAEIFLPWISRLHKKFLKLIPKRTKEGNKRARDKSKEKKEVEGDKAGKAALTICCSGLLNITFRVGSIMEG